MSNDLKKFQNLTETRLRGVNDGAAFSRRQFFQLSGLGLTGFFFSQVASPLDVMAQSAPPLLNKARNCIYIHMSGAPSHVDTFDLKEGAWTPTDFEPTSYGDIRWARGLMPKLGDQMSRIALVRSMTAWALVHPLAQIWQQIGRSPANPLAKVAPNIGSVVAFELEGKRRQDQVLPGFIALNTNSMQRQGYFPPNVGPFMVTPSAAGLANATHPEGEARFRDRFTALTALDGEMRRSSSPLGSKTDEMAAAYAQARGLMYNPQVQQAFQYSTADSQAYGTTGFGNACLTARNILRSDLGTRFIQITIGGWDMHQDIYNRGNNGSLYGRCREFDNGLAQLMTDLAATPSKSGQGTLLDETLIVAMGEFGRTVGALNNQRGRDHYAQMSTFLAGAGIKGGKVVGKTDATGSRTIDTGWDRNVDIRVEDIFSTIYSALGIDYTITRTDDPLNRGFEYVPYAKDGVYAPLDLLWQA